MKKNLKLSLRLCVFATVLTLTPASLAGLTQSTSPGAIFTEAQARRGQAVYDGKCASCHGAQLEGGSASALTGSKFISKWAGGNHDVDELFYITRTTMPSGAGGTLSNQQYLDTVAYILKANGYKAGARALPTDSALLKQIKITPQGSVKEKAFETTAGNGTKTAQPSMIPTAKSPTQEELNAAPGSSTIIVFALSEASRNALNGRNKGARP